MLRKLTSPFAVATLLLLAGATAFSTAFVYRGEGEHMVSFFEDIFHFGMGVFALGVVFAAFMLVFRIWRWENFVRIKAVGAVWLWLLMNAATFALFPAIAVYAVAQTTIFNEWDVAVSTRAGIALAAALYLFAASNILFFVALPHTTLPAKMAISCKRRSKELNTWRAVFALLLLADIAYLASCISLGAVTGVIASAVYMYVIFALHAGKVAWKEGIRA